MRTTFSIICLLFCLSSFGQKATDKAVKESCVCLTALQGKKLDETKLREATTKCMTDALVDNIAELAKEYGYDISEINGQTGEQIGQKFGIQLATDCPASVPFLMLLGQEELKKNEKALETPMGYLSSGSTKGILQKVDGAGDNVSLSLKLDDGSVENFLWMRRFVGSDGFEKNYKKFIGKKVTIKWGEFEKYVLNLKTYGKYKEVFALVFE